MSFIEIATNIMTSSSSVLMGGLTGKAKEKLNEIHRPNFFIVTPKNQISRECVEFVLY